MNFTIKQARNYAGLTAKDVATGLGVSVKTYSEYENYKKVFRVDTALQFSKITKLDFESIIFFSKNYI